MMMGDYKKAVKKYLELYYHVAKDVKPRVRANEANEDQLEKIAILNNLVIAFLLKE